MRLLCFCAALVATAICGCGNGETGGVSVPQHSIQLLDLDERQVDFWHRDAAVTVVVFTRTDCPIANRYAPEIRRLFDLYHQRGVEFTLIYVDPRENAASIRRHLQEFGYPCSAFRDPKHTLAAYCGATRTPEAVVFAKDRTMTYRGRIDDLYVDVGKPRAEATAHNLADAIEATLDGQPVAEPRTNAVGCLIADLK
jgi:hypothetical protein